MLKKLFLFCSAGILAASMSVLPVAAQKNTRKGKPMRVEIEAKAKADDYHIVPVGTNGLLLFYESDEKVGKGEKMWYFSKYDEDFKEVWTKQLPVPKRMEFRQYDNTNEKVHVLVSEKAKSGANYQVLEVDVAKGQTNIVSGIVPMEAEMTNFKVMEGDAYMGGTTSYTTGQACAQTCLTYSCITPIFGVSALKTNACLLNANMKNKSVCILPQSFKGSSAVTSINSNPTNGETYTLLSNSPSKKERDMYLQTYKNGKQLSTVKIDPKGENQIISGRVHPVDEKERLIFGTYANPSGKKGGGVAMVELMTGLNQAYAQGIYVSKLNGKNQEFIKYYSFTDLKNFFNYLDTRTANKVTEKADKKKAQGKDLKLAYQLLIHDIIQQDDNFLMIAEAYYPEYHTETYTDYVSDGKGGSRAVTRTRQVFDGYRYTHALVASFDESGKLLWDNTFPIHDILTFKLKERVKVLPGEGKEVALLYNSNSEIKSMIIEGKKIAEGKKSTKIETASKNDKVKENYEADIDYWYDNYFIAWGYQKIKDKSKSGIF